MYNYEYRDTTKAGRVCQELSLKPFGYDLSDEGIERVCRDYYKKWAALFERAEGLAVLLWTSDGSEIFEFTGDLDTPFEWCKYIGIGNYERGVDKAEAAKRKSLHAFPIHYMENPPEMTYRDLARIIACLKRVGKEMTGFDVQIGETFDPGPEFAYSAFKYERHPEIASGNIMGKRQWLHCAVRLHAEDRAYAAYPNGIPEGTHIGEFLGRQFMALKKAVGFDYLWLSNGFGFALDAWNWTGELFDGEKFDFSGAAHIRSAIEEFWKVFTAEIGDTPIETRGTNLAAGMDIAAHGCPLDVIYEQNIIAPPNSPWAAMDYRFGLELSGYMSHIARIPRGGFSFRYYSHDPWWYNSPWFDRYDRSPHDIYLPLGIARLDKDLTVTKPTAVDFLTADDSFGRVPSRGANEMTPHILTAFEDYPDEAGLVTWVYPIADYCRIGLHEGHPERIFMDDWFIESAIDYGFPVSSVIADENFIPCDKSRLKNTILFAPVPDAASPMEAALYEALDAGCKVILYGTTQHASGALRARIGVTLADKALEGTLTIDTGDLAFDKSEVGERSDKLIHESLVSGGGIYEVTSDGREDAFVTDGGEKRAYVVHKGNLIWIRGSFPHKSEKNEGHLPILAKMSERFVPSILMRAVLPLCGYSLTFDVFDVNDKLPLLVFTRSRGAMFFNEFSKDTTIRMRMTTPYGAPAPDNGEFFAENGYGIYPVNRWRHDGCRVYVDQKNRSRIAIKKNDPNTHIDNDERIDVEGLDDATVRFFPSAGGKAVFRVIEDNGIWRNANLFLGDNIPSRFDEEAGCYVLEHVSGLLVIGWCAEEQIGRYKALEFLREV